MGKHILFIGLFILSIFKINAQTNVRQDYVMKYKHLAIKEMKRTGIPASITLAQGILESGSGQSRLARKANNHFGIKSHNWNGPYIRVDDDKKNEKFRKYKSVEHSYKDHSHFLTSKNRYASLFKLNPKDYKGWARGLKKAGYATASNYDKMLIRIIEEEQLYKYDNLSKKEIKQYANSNNINSLIDRVETNNKRHYVLLKSGDTYYSISKSFDIPARRIRRYNELHRKHVLKAGEIIYIQKKRGRAVKGKEIHFVKAGESLHDIAQKYGIRLKRLLKYNYMKKNTVLNEDEKIFLRGKARF